LPVADGEDAHGGDPDQGISSEFSIHIA
jgi:hypothetical protein